MTVALTACEMARRLGVYSHQVYYAIKRLELEPAMKVGHIRVFRDADLLAVGAFLARVHAKHEQAAKQATQAEAA